MYENSQKKTIFDKNHEQRENPVDALFLLTKNISKEINKDVKERYKTNTDLVDDRGILQMDFFSRAQGGIYTPEEIKNDKEHILMKEIEWSGAHDPHVQKFYKEERGIEGKEAIAKVRMKDKEREKSSQMEMLTNAIFYKILKDRFLVVRSSTHDDYFSGVDNYLVDKETGDIVCAFDEVHDHAHGDRKEKKWERVESIGKGGKKIKYGIVPQGDKLIQKEIRNIPVFFLSLTTEELNRGMRGFSRDVHGVPNQLEKETFNKYISLLEEEYSRIKDMEMPRPTKENLEKFKRALQTMKEIGNIKTPSS
ncbi:hypothetical protein C4565_10700 [Candidatus Parcubacteria bacterium]|jgi:hypothetical protein|nr:MAG: hypothetical protein C4565_10700 [Candidatus Parcubacteria bacterium]